MFHSSLRKIMHVTSCYMPCMHHVSASRLPSGPCAGRGMRDAGYELRRTLLPRGWVNSAAVLPYFVALLKGVGCNSRCLPDKGGYTEGERRIVRLLGTPGS